MTPPSGEFKSIQSLLQQVHSEADKKAGAVGDLPGPAEPTEEELREIVAQFRARIERDEKVKNLIDRYRRRGWYAIRPWHWATLVAGFLAAAAIVFYASLFLTTRARMERAVEAAVAAARRGDGDESLRRLKDAIDLGAPPGRARATVADVLRESGDPERLGLALSLYAAAAQDEPDEPLFVVRAAEMEAALGRTEESRARVRRALDLFPRALDVLLIAGRFALKDGRLAEAEAHLRDLVNRDPANLVGRFFLYETYRARGYLEGMRREEEFLRTADPRSIEEYEVLVGLADIYIRAGRNEEARALLQRLVGRADAPARVFLTLARLAVDSADLPGAEGHLNEAIRRAPHEAEAYVLRGEVRYVLGDLRAAAADFRTAREIDPRHARACYDLGALLFFDLDDLDGARDLLEEAGRLGFAEPALAYTLGAVRYRLGDDSAALAAFDSLPANWRSHAEVEWARASARLGAGETEGVRAALRAVALRRKDPPSYNNYALALEAAGETTAALRVLFNAARMSPVPGEADPVVRANIERFLEGRPLDLRRDLHRGIEKRIVVAATPSIAPRP